MNEITLDKKTLLKVVIKENLTKKIIPMRKGSSIELSKQLLKPKKNQIYYNIIDSVSILLAPESFGPLIEVEEFNLKDPVYHETYTEMSFYHLGTKIFGKRESDVFCRQIDKKRIKPFEEHFINVMINYYGLFIRYIFIVLEKTGIIFCGRKQ